MLLAFYQPSPPAQYCPNLLWGQFNNTLQVTVQKHLLTTYNKNVLKITF